MPADFISLLAWLTGPGLAAITAFVLERLQSFQSLSPNGKLVVAVTVATLCGLLAVFLQQTVAPNAEVVALLDPYVKVLIPALSILAQQLTHGAQNRDY